jgi:hypothetical protein
MSQIKKHRYKKEAETHLNVGHLAKVVAHGGNQTQQQSSVKQNGIFVSSAIVVHRVEFHDA